jgi:hydroxypyruvate isomerase
MAGRLGYAVNCSLLFTEVPLLERPAAAAAAGFSAIEFWWPWPDQPVPADREVDAFVSAVRDAGVSLIGLNFFAGDLAGPDAGMVSLPARVQDFRDNVDVVVDIGRELGVPAFNALYGVRVDDSSATEQDAVAAENLTHAAGAVAAIGGTVLLEPVSGPKPYPLRTAADVVTVLDRVAAPNVGFLCDMFHLANNGVDIDAAIDAYAPRIAHVQVADHPGRHEPGTGTLDIDRYLRRIADAGYAGRVALEYVPSGPTLDSLRWLPVAQRG